jgi:hypothetical protein
MEKNTSVCERGFLAAIKRKPRKNIHEVTSYAHAICAGKKPDLKGKYKQTPYFKVKEQELPETKHESRPLYPTLRKLKQIVKGGSPAMIDNYIIGIINKNGDLILCRPKVQEKN